jgi:hypothetical protein
MKLAMKNKNHQGTQGFRDTSNLRFADTKEFHSSLVFCEPMVRVFFMVNYSLFFIINYKE